MPRTELSPCGRYTIRPIQPQDNQAVAEITLEVLGSFGYIGPGYASSDPELHYMYETYQALEGEYWVVVDHETKQVMGGCGFSRLRGTTPEESICELQKLYFLPALRGKGLSKQLVALCIAEARGMGFDRMYLESTPPMTTAIRLYEAFGFEHIPQPLGNTGHHACQVFMVRSLAKPAVLASV